MHTEVWRKRFGGDENRICGGGIKKGGGERSHGKKSRESHSGEKIFERSAGEWVHKPGQNKTKVFKTHKGHTPGATGVVI